MFSPPEKERSRAGFSLLEMLAAVTLVSVLVALVVPVTKTFMASAKSTKCVSNMRQIGLGLNAYAADHDDAYPPIVISTAGWKYWDMDAIWDYAMGSASSSTSNYYTNYKQFIFYCPASDPTKNCSYGMNAMFPAGVKNFYQPRKRSSISKPASCLLLGEGTNHAVDSWWFASPPGQPMTFPHNGAQNLLFADLHVESRKKEALPKGGWSAIETADAFWTGN